MSPKALPEPPVEPSPISQSVDEAAPLEEPYGGRFDLGDRTLREHATRGALINSAFQVGLAGLGLVRNLVVAAFLTASEFGLWGLIVTTLLTLAWLKQVGVGDKYVQQDEPDQELAFQKAFTLELAYSLLLYPVIALALPLYALIYGQPEIIVPGLILALAIVASAMQTPIWIAFRQMRFLRQRTLEAIDPVVSTVLVIGLAVAGAGYWSLVIGLVAGAVASATAAVITCPYPLRLRYDRGTLREYFSFSWPLAIAGASGMIVVQGSVIIGDITVGLAGIGAIGLAFQVAKFADQVDAIVSRTIYPAICAVKDRVDLLFESFVKSNRLALMWALPFGIGLALFAPDLVEFVLGETWLPAQGLLQAFGVIIGLRQVAFNWGLFFSALGRTRPMAVEGVAILIVFIVATAPLMFAFGLTGYAIGIAITVAAQLAVRAWYLSRLFEGFRFLGYLGRAVAPTALAAAVVLASRALVNGDRSLGLALAECALYTAVTVLATLAFERPLLSEIVGYLRGAGGILPAGRRDQPGALAG